MPRLARLDAPGVLHHVIGRGIEKRNIFLNDQDREDFLTRLSILAEKRGLEIYAWVLMPNHFHLLVKTKNLTLAQSMRRLLTGYAVNFNRRHKRYGHLFQNRYKSIVCQEDAYLKELVRYIHLNPLRAGLVRDINELTIYPWSGHASLMGRIKREFQNTDYVLGFFGEGMRSRHNYFSFFVEGIRQGRRPELVGGGLIRSLGGWSEVRALRIRGERVDSDQRVLGDGEFVEMIRTELDNFPRRNHRHYRQKGMIEELAGKICLKYNLSEGELCSGSRRRAAIKARQEMAWKTVREWGYSGADVARFLGVTNSCVTRIVASTQKPEK